MLAQIPSAKDIEALRSFREILTGLDPEVKVAVDEHAGEILVKGQLDAQQIDEAIERSGISMRVVAADGSGCCGGCGCG